MGIAITFCVIKQEVRRSLDDDYNGNGGGGNNTVCKCSNFTCVFRMTNKWIALHERARDCCFSRTHCQSINVFFHTRRSLCVFFCYSGLFCFGFGAQARHLNNTLNRQGSCQLCIECYTRTRTLTHTHSHKTQLH